MADPAPSLVVVIGRRAPAVARWLGDLSGLQRACALEHGQGIYGDGQHRKTCGKSADLRGWSAQAFVTQRSIYGNEPLTSGAEH